MKLAVFTNQFPCKISSFFSRDMMALSRAGMEIDIFPIYPLDKNMWQYVPDILNENVLPRDKVHHIRIMDFLYLLKPSNMFKMCRILKDAIQISISGIRFGLRSFIKSLYVIMEACILADKHNVRYDHVLAYWGNYSATYAYIYQKLTNPNSVFSLFLHAGTDLYRDQVFLKEKLYYADNIIVVCEYNRYFLQSLYPHIYNDIKDKIILYHLGVDLLNYPFNEKEKKKNKIVAIGRLSKEKGFEYLLLALYELKKRNIKFEFELVGDGEEKNNLCQLARKLKIMDYISFSGWMNLDDVKNILGQSTVLVHPSPNIGDAVPTVIKEAMALGVPVIASNVAGIPELLNYGKSGILVQPRDSSSLASAIEKIINNNMLANKYSIEGRKYAEDTFDLFNNIDELVKVLSNINVHR